MTLTDSALPPQAGRCARDALAFARGTGKREVPQRLEGRLDRADEARCNLRRRFGCQGGPDFGEVVLSFVS